MEEPILFDSTGGVRLEGLYADSVGSTGVVIAHPHPLMGGEMRNPIVEIVTKTLLQNGLSTLRFNFRGVGKSSGSYDEGRGEKEDLLASFGFLKQRGKSDIILIGYSFGAWICAGVISRSIPSAVVFIAPAIGLLRFDIAPLQGRIGLIVCGNRDPFCPFEKIASFAARLTCPLVFIDTDHFFLGRERVLARYVSAFLEKTRS
jgi:uncharacterized protein